MKKIIDIKLNIPTPQFDGYLDLIGLSFKVFFKSFWFIAVVTLVFFGPLEFLKNVVDPDGSERIRGHLYSLLDFLVVALVEPMVIFGVAHYLKSKKFPTYSAAMTFGFRKWFLVFGQNFVVGMLVLVGLLMFIVPGIYLGIAYSLIVPVICFEETKKENFRSRARKLTLGHRGFILTSVFLLVLLAFVVCFALGMALYLLCEWAGAAGFGDFLIGCISQVIMEVVVVGYLLLYLKLRKDKSKRPEETWFIRWAN